MFEWFPSQSPLLLLSSMAQARADQFGLLVVTSEGISLLRKPAGVSPFLSVLAGVSRFLSRVRSEGFLFYSCVVLVGLLRGIFPLPHCLGDILLFQRNIQEQPQFLFWRSWNVPSEFIPNSLRVSRVFLVVVSLFCFVVGLWRDSLVFLQDLLREC